MIPSIVQLKQDIRVLSEQVLKLNEQGLREFLSTDERIDTLTAKVEELHMRNVLLSAHVENLIERVYVLENGEDDCTCGYGGQHEPGNPRCQRNQMREMRAGGEITSD